MSFRKTDSHPNNQRDGYSTGMTQKELRDDVGVSMLSSVPDMHMAKPNDSEQHSPILASNGAAVGLYSSSTDPVHVPSPDSRSSAAVGAIKREVGAVGVRRQLKDSSINQSSGPSVSLTNSVAERDGSSSDSFQPLSSISKGEQLSQITESVITGLVGSRSTLNSQHSSRQHQPTMGHQKGILVSLSLSLFLFFPRLRTQRYLSIFVIISLDCKEFGTFVYKIEKLRMQNEKF